MLNFLSLLIGGVSLVLVLLAFLPFFGWMNWFFLPLPIIGLALGAVARSKSGRNLNLIVIIIGVARLILGGGLF
jgi:hypothetical protein